MRAIKIDSLNRAITEIENTGLESLQAAVSGYITIAYDYPDGSTCFVNDEGLFTANNFFSSKFGHQPFAGNGIIVGPVDNEGESTECTLTIEEIKASTKFLSPLEVQLMYSRDNS
jgi:hypothetical protein